jgi:hypothetical protein
MKMVLLLSLVLAILVGSSVSGQLSETVLIYSKRVDNEYLRVVQYSTGISYVHSIFIGTPQPTEPLNCGDFSPDGMFDAFARQISPTTLSLRYVPTNEVFVQIAWRTGWDPCKMNWLDNQKLVVRFIDSYDIAAMFTIQDDLLREVLVSVPSAPTPVPPLPNADISPLRRFILSNQETKVTYLRCADGAGAENFCSGYPDWAIYDLSLSSEIAVLSDVDMDNVLGQAYFQYSVPFNPQFYRWSPDDRYFLYASNAPGVFSIYDTVAQQALDVPEQNWGLDLERLPVWSPDSRYVAYWTVGLPDNDEFNARYNITSEEDAQSYRGLLIYDTQRQDFLGSGIWLQLGENYPPAIVWSPNTPELVTWGEEGDLYRLNVETGAQAVIDTNVTGVIAWSYTRPIPSVELPAASNTSGFAAP